jgi:hypothetical protein
VGEPVAAKKMLSVDSFGRLASRGCGAASELCGKTRSFQLKTNLVKET